MEKLPPLERPTPLVNLNFGWLSSILFATPVIVTVISGLLAGLASSEMNKAQYERAHSAEMQSKAGEQRGFFQAKRLLGEMQRNTLDTLGLANTPQNVPAAPPPPAVTPELRELYDAVDRDAPQADINARLGELEDAQLEEALKGEEKRLANYEGLIAPRIKELVDAPAGRRLAFNAARYDEEAKLHAATARVRDLQVRKINLKAERHQLRSQRFFLCMLAAQAAVILAAFAIAAKRKNLLWSLATAVGLLAVCFAAYAYLYL